VFAYNRVAMQEFRPGDWCFDPYAKQCERCDTVIGRYAVMVDDEGFRNVLFWPHREWDGVEGSARCRRHSNVGQQWLRLF
jgi:hypothetical protein